MVTEAGFFIDVCTCSASCQARRGQVIVQTPAHILRIRLPAVAPPGVALVSGFWVQTPIHIHQWAFGGHVRHPRALFWQKAAVLLVAFPILQIGLLVRNVHITAHNEFTLRAQRLEVWPHVVQETKLGFLTLRARGATGEISADNRQLALRRVKAQLHKTAFCIKLLTAHAHNYLAGFVLAVHRHTRVALLFGKMKMTLQSCQGLKFAGHIGRLCFNLLHANTIRIVLSNPSLHPFGGRRADAVQVQAA